MISRRRGTGRALLVVTIAALAAKASALGCDDRGSYVFSGEQYNSTLHCLEPVASIDIVAGTQPGSCPPECILTVPQDGGQIAYVSTMCGPYPAYPFETDAEAEPLCVAALSAFREDALCEDGGVVVLHGPDAEADGAADATAGDAMAEAGDATALTSDAGALDAAADATSPGTDAGLDAAAE